MVLFCDLRVQLQLNLHASATLVVKEIEIF